MVDNNKKNTPTQKIPQGVSPAAYPFIGSRAGTSLDTNKETNASKKNKKDSIKTSPEEETSEKPLPHFLQKDAHKQRVKEEKISRKKQKKVKSISKEVASPTSSQSFSEIQNYLANSNQYFFSINKFTVVGISCTLFFLGILFFISGFLTALFLISYGASNSTLGTYDSIKSNNPQEVTLITKTIEIPENKSLKRASKTDSLKNSSKNSKNKKKQNTSSKTTKTFEQKDNTQHKEASNTDIKKVQSIVKDPNNRKKYTSISLLSTPSKSEAIKKSQELKKKGYNVFIVHQPATKNAAASYRIQLGAYKNPLFSKKIFEFVKNHLSLESASVIQGILKNDLEKLIEIL